MSFHGASLDLKFLLSLGRETYINPKLRLVKTQFPIQKYFYHINS